MAEIIHINSEYYRGYKIAVRPGETQTWNVAIRRWDSRVKGEHRVAHGRSSRVELIVHGRSIIDGWTDDRVHKILNK